MTVAPTSVSVKVGATAALTKTIAPSNADEQGGTWTSSNPAIATVDANGVVRGVATGSAKITFTTKDGSIVSSQVTVTVTAAS
ncbi:hypothetical protein SQ54_21825 [Klebsiella pneumoniae]|nr:Ig domain-containing protein [Klebsiella variicola]KYL88466.1 hypothetical protein SQ54_21825 [Klebsiella pneumoniae]